MAGSPRAFISHSSLDKDRFVTAFGERLRANGVDAWVDSWEMLPGDSLVEKILAEGLSGADTVIAVVSRHSLESKWVAEELDHATILRIQSGTRVLPVLIDKDVVPPPQLRTLVYEPIQDLNSY